MTNYIGILIFIHILHAAGAYFERKYRDFTKKSANRSFFLLTTQKSRYIVVGLN